MAKLSRRDFLKFAGKSALGAAAVSMVPVNGLAEGPGGPGGPFGGPATLYTPGTYTATGTGRNGDVTVTMTFDENNITDIVMDISGETQEIVGDAADKLAKAMFDKQSADVDAVTGATITSDGV